MSQSRHRVLSLAVCACCHEAGYSTADESVIDILTTMLNCMMSETAKESQALAEHNGRSEATPGDVVSALIDMGLNVDSIIEYGLRRNLIHIPTPATEQPQKQPTILQVGQSRPHHLYIPEYFPPFPDPHSYIRTPTHKQPISEYEAIRDKAATQKRDLERALTRFVAKTSETSPEESLFGNNANLNKCFPLIPVKPTRFPYLTALLPKDQIFDDSDDET